MKEKGKGVVGDGREGEDEGRGEGRRRKKRVEMREAEREKGREEGRKKGREWKEAEGGGGIRMQKRGKEGEEVRIGRFNEGK